jgi:hypothetical protein
MLLFMYLVTQKIYGIAECFALQVWFHFFADVWSTNALHNNMMG